MATTFLPSKHIGYPAVNDLGWGPTVNQTLINADTAFGGHQAFNLSTASGTVAVSATSYNGPYPANVASYVPLTWTLTGTLTANVDLQLPTTVGGHWLIQNICFMGPYTIRVLTTAAGSTSAILNAGSQIVFSDSNGNVALASAYFPPESMFVALWPGVQNIPVSTFTILNFTAANDPTWGNWSGNTMTIITPGRYLITTAGVFTGTYSSSVSGQVQLGAYRNGGSISSLDIACSAPNTTCNFVLGVTTIIGCIANDTLDIRAILPNTQGAFTSGKTNGPENNLYIVRLS